MGDNTEALLPVEDEQQLAERMGGCVSGAITCLMLCIGDKAGLYTKLQEVGPSTPAQLAQAAGLNERWVREWLHQQAAARFISTDKDAGTFWLSPAQSNILAQEKDSPCFMMGLPTTMPAFFSKQDELVHCFRTGVGLTYDALGADCACGTHRELGVWIRHNLVKHIRQLPEVAAALDKGVLVADVGCGCGEALMVLAKEFPNSTFRGYDTSHHALHIAEQRIAAADIHNITLHNPDHGPDHSLPSQPTFSLVMVHDALHDMTRPDLCLKAIHGSLLKEAPACLIAGDWRSLGSPAANIQQLPVASMMYGFSVAVCMSSALSAPGGLGLGTLGFHEAVARKMMVEAGFAAVDMLEWGSELNAYYLAKP